MIKYNGQDIADIKYNGSSIKRVMKDGVQIWPIESGLPETPTGIQLSEYEIIDIPETPTGIQVSEYEILANIDWDYTKMYIGEGDNTNLVTLYFTGQDADITSIPAITDWVLDPFNVVNTVTVYTDRVELLVNTAFTSSSSVTISYTPGVNPLKDIDGHLLTELNDQALENLLPEPAYTYLLDDYPGAVTAYSLRKLRTGAVQGIMVRRDSDDQLVDVRLYDDPNKLIDLDSITESGDQTLGEWVGSGSAFIFNWYDQTETGNATLSQSDSLKQPLIVDSGTLIVSNDNGLTGVKTDSIALQHLSYNVVDTSLRLTEYSGFHVNEALSRVQQAVISTGATAVNNAYISMGYQSSADTFAIIDRGNTNGQINTPSPAPLNTVLLQSGIKTSNTYRSLWVNGSYIGDSTNSVGQVAPEIIYLNRLRSSDQLCGDAIYQESIIYLSDETANRVGIEANINNVYNMYLKTAEVDAQLIQADADNVSDTVIEINGVRSSASDTAVANLISRNNTVITN